VKECSPVDHRGLSADLAGFRIETAFLIIAVKFIHVHKGVGGAVFETGAALETGTGRSAPHA
jgi:hypothetical protein